jgi:hypothetical protein
MPVLEWGDVPNRPDADTFSIAPESNESQVETRTAVALVTPTVAESKTAAESPPAVEVPKRSPLVPRDPGNQFALAAAALTGLGLVASLVPYGRAATVLLAGVGVLVGVLGILAADRSRRWAATAAGGSAVVLAVVCFAPDWLGLRPWWDAAAVEDETAGQIRAVSRSGGGAAAASGEWVDASQSGWRQDDVQVAVSALVGPVEVVNAKGQKKWTREKYLQVTVKVSNKGVERRLQVSAWPLADGSTIQATADGIPMTAPKFESGWSPVNLPAAAGVFPGKSHTQVFAYALPAAGDVQLTIPAAGIDAHDAAKILIPRTAYASVGRPRH